MKIHFNLIKNYFLNSIKITKINIFKIYRIIKLYIRLFISNVENKLVI